jgi:hypothetical protein
MRQHSASDTLRGSLSLVESIALLLWLMVGLQTLFGLVVTASRVVTIALPT